MSLRLWVSDLKRSGSLIEEAGVTASTGLFLFCQFDEWRGGARPCGTAAKRRRDLSLEDLVA